MTEQGYPLFRTASPPATKCTKMAPRHQLDRNGCQSHWLGWRAYAIGGFALAFLAVLIYLHAVGTLLTFLALGQFCRAVALFRRDRRRDSLQPSLAVVEKKRNH